MAGEWLKMESATPDKPEVFAITTEMGWDDPDLTVGKLFRVWRWFDQQTTDGNARGVTSALLDRIAGVTGFAQAMINVGWLVSTTNGVGLPNFDKHNGATAKSRAQGSKRVASHRSNAVCNGLGNAPTVTKPLPEKRREEKNIKEPHTPQAGQKSASAISLQTYLENCRQAGKKPIDENHSVFEYADKTGIPHDFLRLQWLEFKARYTMPGAKRYKAWQTVFLKSVRGNWFKLWYATDGTYVLTTTGQQAKAAHREAA